MSDAASQEEATPAEVAPAEVMGLDHPLMTQDLAATILPDGPRIPIPLLNQLGHLLNPFTFRTTTAGDLLAIGDALNRHLDEQLKAAQASPASR
jgi:hypothetical protein